MDRTVVLAAPWDPIVDAVLERREHDGCLRGVVPVEGRLADLGGGGDVGDGGGVVAVGDEQVDGRVAQREACLGLLRLTQSRRSHGRNASESPTRALATPN